MLGVAGASWRFGCDRERLVGVPSWDEGQPFGSLDLCHGVSNEQVFLFINTEQKLERISVKWKGLEVELIKTRGAAAETKLNKRTARKGWSLTTSLSFLIVAPSSWSLSSDPSDLDVVIQQKLFSTWDPKSVPAICGPSMFWYLTYSFGAFKDVLFLPRKFYENMIAMRQLYHLGTSKDVLYLGTLKRFHRKPNLNFQVAIHFPGPCDRSCGVGQSMRGRHITESPRNGGQAESDIEPIQKGTGGWLFEYEYICIYIYIDGI